MRILITSIGGTLIPYLVKFLKQDTQLPNLYIVGIDKKKKIKKNKYLNKFYSIKTNNDQTYLKNILKICVREKIELLIPWSDKEAVLLSEFKKNFTSKKIKVMVNNFSVIKKITNKFLTYEILKKARVRTPNYCLVKNKYQLTNALNKFEYPKKGVVLKPVSSRGGRGVKILQGKNLKLEKWIGSGKREKIIKINDFFISESLFKYGELIVMDILKSPAFDVDSFCQKNTKVLSIRKRINPSGIPYKGNLIINNKIIKKYCKKISEVLNLKYLTDIDLLHDQNNKIVLLEVNPRPSGSIATAYSAKIPIFSYAIAKTLNKNYKLPSPKFNIKVKL